MGIVCEGMNLLQWITASAIKWPNSNPGIYTRRRAHSGALAFRSLWRPRNTPISLHYHRWSLPGSITRQNRGENMVGFCMKSGTKNMRSRSKFPGLLWQHIFLFNKLGSLARNPVFSFFPPGRPDFHKRRFAERSAILPGHPSNTRACVPEMW